MNVDSIDKLKSSMISTYKKFGDKKALITGGRSYSGNEIAQEIENETEFGIGIIDNMIQLSIDLVSRDKINLS